MIPIPTLPTDNLYKFVALSGVAVFLAGVLLPTIDDKEMTARMIDLMTKAEVVKAKEKGLEAENDDLTRLKNHFEKRFDQVLQHPALAKKVAPGSTPQQNIDDITKERDALVAKKDDVVTKSRALGVEIAAITADVAIMDRYFKIRGQTLYLGMGLSLVGSVLAGWGFKRWYQRIQVYLDQALKNEAEKNKATVT